jgi:hypothetical protein
MLSSESLLSRMPSTPARDALISLSPELQRILLMRKGAGFPSRYVGEGVFPILLTLPS